MRKHRSISKIIASAVKNGRVRDGLVFCDNCDTPASKSLSTKLSWTGCASCVWHETDSFDPEDVIEAL